MTTQALAIPASSLSTAHKAMPFTAPMAMVAAAVTRKPSRIACSTRTRCIVAHSAPTR
jgi:hypothetical protein